MTKKATQKKKTLKSKNVTRIQTSFFKRFYIYGPSLQMQTSDNAVHNMHASHGANETFNDIILNI